ncbi:MAG: AMP-binding protein [Polaromonas sp.]|uniref:AMP-binding protein n=1 Tax=Polaromonas sp. TaxID=1869339 RepID=UPI00326513D6
MTTFPLIAHTQADDVVACGHGQTVTAGHFLADVRQLAAALPAGKHVLNVCADRYRFAVGMAAALLADKISLLPPTLTPEMVKQVRSFAPDVFCLADQPQSFTLPLLHWADAMPPRSPDTASVAPYEVPQIPASRIATIMFTSGSTGTPVAHRKSWGGLVRSARAEAGRLGLLDGRKHSIVATVPPQHMFGFESTVLLPLQSGAILVAAHPFYPADICTALAESGRPRMLVTTPVHLKALMSSGLDIPKTDQLLSATAPLPPQLALATEERLQAPLLEIYGSTETGQIATRRMTQDEAWTLFPDVTLSVKQGQTWASGGHIDQSTPLADELESLSETRFILHGRTADLINIAGKRSSLGYLNHQLHAIPGVMDGAFFMPDDGPGDTVVRLMAFVVAPGLTAPTLLAALRERVDAIFIPRPLVLLDALPRNSTGKLPRDMLAALAREHLQKRPLSPMETRFSIEPDHPAFAGHFPGSPIVPGVLLLDAALHAVRQARGTPGSAGATVPADICQISSAKFLSPVGPGETLTISCTNTASGGTRFDICSGDRKVATGTLVLSPSP